MKKLRNLCLSKILRLNFVHLGNSLVLLSDFLCMNSDMNDSVVSSMVEIGQLLLGQNMPFSMEQT